MYSHGCDFVRVENGDSINWVPRVNLSHDQLCVSQFKLASGSTSISPTMHVPNPLETPFFGLTACFIGTSTLFIIKIPTLCASVATFFMAKTSSLTGQGAKALIASHHVVAATRLPFVRTAPIIQQSVLTHA